MSPTAQVPRVSTVISHVLREALAQAGVQLGVLLDRSITFQGTHLAYVGTNALAGPTGDAPEHPVTAVYRAFSGDMDGHVLVTFVPEVAVQVAQALLRLDDLPPDPTVQQLAASALGELGNVMTAAFLNAVASLAGLTLRPSPPCVVQDLRGAVLQAVAVVEAEVAALQMQSALVVDGVRGTAELLLVPSEAGIARLRGSLESGGRLWR